MLQFTVKACLKVGGKVCINLKINFFFYSVIPLQVSSMMEPCVTPVVSSPSLVFDGNVLSVQIMTFVQPVTMETSIT